ncbi:STAS domain-containing protein [Nonomuraea endophytica]|uniref:STAS domain-containing protein n=1 Tax=Nonomuraea endophytica TaxID=714136 RepID=UPI0037C89E1F
MNAIITPNTVHDQVIGPFTIACRHVRITQMLDPRGLRIEGELDLAALPDLAWALAALPRDGDLCLDLADVTFIDVGCLRALITTAARLREGRVMWLCSPSPQVRRLLQLTGWHVAPRLWPQGAPPPALSVAALRRLGRMVGLRPPPSLA